MGPPRQPVRRGQVRPVLLTLAFVVTACGGAATNRAADMAGFVTSVSGRPDGVTVLVEADPSHPSLGDKASVAVTSGTRITRRGSSGEVAASFRDLVPGLRVEVWFDGPVATSYPVQGRAQTLVIVR